MDYHKDLMYQICNCGHVRWRHWSWYFDITENCISCGESKCANFNGFERMIELLCTDNDNEKA